MIKNLKLRVRPEVWADAQKLEEEVARQQAIAPDALRGLRIQHQSIDARQRQVMVQLDLDAYINEEPPQQLFEPLQYRPLPATAPQAVVVGAGPGGLFAALKLIELGVRPVVVERGRNVTDRRRDVAAISRQGVVDADSNYCFGEGGAGAFSDGKLFTRSKKRGNVQQVLERLCQFGADTGILSAAHPHLGTDRLPAIIAAVREEILRCGGEIHFATRMTDLLMRRAADGSRHVCGIVAADSVAGRELTFDGPVILATGHSARDVYELMYAREVNLEHKGIAMGVRLEHPQTLIDQIQYHSRQGRGAYLPPAEYSFVTQVAGSDGVNGATLSRGVYSFCMCPGGVVVPSATQDGQVVVNGMSSSSRGGRFANAAMVVEIRPDDVPVLAAQLGLHDEQLHVGDRPLQAGHPLVTMLVQQELERQTWLNGGGAAATGGLCAQAAPAQRMDDFVHGRLSADLPASSYAPGVVASPLHFWMPHFISHRLRSAFSIFGRNARGFLTNDALLIASETRTSAPVRIPRDREMLVHPTVAGLYPCGEGAGFAGGIVSAALDGERCAEALVASCFG